MQVRIPRYLHLPLQILWFDMEEIGVIAGMYLLYLMIDSAKVLPLLIIVPWAFKTVKARMPRGYLKHLAYRLGFWNSKSYPHTAVMVHHE